jgi:hypothetical protein
VADFPAMIIDLAAEWSPWQHFAVMIDDHGARSTR